MENVIVTIVGSETPPLEAKRAFNEAEGMEYLEIEGDDILQRVFRHLDGAISVEVHAQDQSLGLFTLLSGSTNKIVLAKGDPESIQRQLSPKCQKL
ncbi:hypothetical protein [Cronobacter turicensis]|uniref:hypothetical protein n=1 Tax=Cronobacter turicensis TaxID=413502 RepID=UPI000CFDC6FE|nr:hypothetical protein [Cronobacter turicensis]